MNGEERHIRKSLMWLLVLSTLARGFLAFWMELGNDEVYYWTYALYPDLSHFDHPPMVGWVIQLFSLNLLFDSEFFLRLSSVLFMTADTYIIYRIGKALKDARTGLYAALLYTASVYAFVVTGIFIMPDTPLMLFWLLAFWAGLRYFAPPRAIPHSAFSIPHSPYLLLFGLFAGLAMLSKYSGIFLWVGMGLYILLFNRQQLKNPYLYLALLISVLCCLPILYWNLNNHFVSFSFHGGRVGGGSLNLSTFLTELAGEILYNNPVNFVLAVVAVVAAFRRKLKMEHSSQRLLLCITLPLILVFLAFSLTRPTLPHWNSPAYVLLILLAAVWLSNKNQPRLPRSIVAALAVLLVTLVVGVAEIKTGFIPLDKHEEPEQLGRDDFTLDLYGWRQLGERFADFREAKIAEGLMQEEDGIVANQWFPLANIDYYVARPLHMRVMGLGWPQQLHKYLWINDERGGFHLGECYWFLTDSRYLKDPKETYRWFFDEIELAGIIPIERNGKTVKNVFVYTCKGLNAPPPTLRDFMADSAAAGE